MSTNEIETLLEKFYEGDTSLQEEKILRDFFHGQDVPAHLKSHKSLFVYYWDERRKKFDDHDFEQRLTARLIGEPAGTPVVFMSPKRSRIMFISGIAASILLLCGLFFTLQDDVFKRKSAQANNRGAETAYTDASVALMMVSGNLNNGLKQMEHLKMVDKAINNIQIITKLYQVQSIIINPDEISNQSIKPKLP